jgi:hypothetical protein
MKGTGMSKENIREIRNKAEDSIIAIDLHEKKLEVIVNLDGNVVLLISDGSSSEELEPLAFVEFTPNAMLHILIKALSILEKSGRIG